MRKAVKRILLDKNGSRAIGVEMVNEDMVYAKNIISSVGFITTFQKLIDKTVSDTLLITKHLKNYDPPLSYFYVFLGLKYSIDECLGIPHTPDRFTSQLLTPHTEIKNLYMTG